MPATQGPRVGPSLIDASSASAQCTPVPHAQWPNPPALCAYGAEASRLPVRMPGTPSWRSWSRRWGERFVRWLRRGKLERTQNAALDRAGWTRHPWRPGSAPGQPRSLLGGVGADGPPRGLGLACGGPRGVRRRSAGRWARLGLRWQTAAVAGTAHLRFADSPVAPDGHLPELSRWETPPPLKAPPSGWAVGPQMGGFGARLVRSDRLAVRTHRHDDTAILGAGGGLVGRRVLPPSTGGNTAAVDTLPLEVGLHG